MKAANSSGTVVATIFIATNRTADRPLCVGITGTLCEVIRKQLGLR
jgi:hypothetical protein